MNRRGFLKLLGLGAGAAVGVALDFEPVRRWWQVGRAAPVGAIAEPTDDEIEAVWNSTTAASDAALPESLNIDDLDKQIASMMRSAKRYNEQTLLFGPNMWPMRVVTSPYIKPTEAWVIRSPGGDATLYVPHGVHAARITGIRS